MTRRYHALLITGPRDFAGDPNFVQCVLGDWFRRCWVPGETLVLVHGACPHPSGARYSVDRIASRWCWKQGDHVQEIPMPAPFDLHGRSAGPRRNMMMVEVLSRLQWCGYQVEAHAICPSESRGGTRNCVEALQVHGFEPVIHERGCTCPAHGSAR